jgi:hypothetical protein
VITDYVYLRKNQAKFIFPKWNLSKTRQLYHAIYSATKDIDITIIYGTIPGEKTEKMKKCHFD